MEDLKSLLGKKSKEGNSMRKEAKLSAIKALRDFASEMMGDDIKGKLTKVTVAAKDQEGLKKGLEKAKEMLPETSSEEESEMESAEEEMAEGPEHEAMEMSSMEECETPEEIDALIKKLEEKKLKMTK